MGKRIISQARGRGSLTYRVRKKAFKYKINYLNIKGKAKIIKLIHSAAHSAPLMKLQLGKDIFYNLAFNKAFEGQEINIDKTGEIKEGDIIRLKDAKIGMLIYNIEANPEDGGRLVRTGGTSASIVKRDKNKILVLMPSKRTIVFNEKCKATVGIIAGGGRLDKPVMKAGRRFYAMKAKGRKWHTTSPVKVNAIDHPFGGGRGKRIKSKIAKRNAPPGKKVGHLRPRKTGRKKTRR
jgi:large subunit ribosomal protein L2